ncbi:MAG: metallophosphoesterase family protein [Pseudomonadales bacterium]|nr:metallophosphoesterase family protein [Pseudomonadales bacterium]
MLAAKLGIIGDVHAEDGRLALALEHLHRLNVDDILCTGDIVDGRGCPNVSVELLKQASVTTVRGNHDRWLLQEKARHVPQAHFAEDLSSDTLEYLNNLSTQETIATIDGNLLLCHGVADDDLRKVWPGTERMPAEKSKGLDDIIRSSKFRYLVNGHMHFRTLIHFETLTLINAGTLKGEHWPGFSVLDLDAQEITAFEFRDNNIMLTKQQPIQEPHHTIWSNTQAFSGGWEPVRLF